MKEQKTGERPLLARDYALGGKLAFKLLLLALAATAAPADDLGYWRLAGVSVHCANGRTLSGYFRWRVYDGSLRPESLTTRLRQIHSDYLELDTALVAVQHPDTGVLVTLADPAKVPLESVLSVVAAPSPLDGKSGYNTPPVTRRQAGLLQSKPVAMCSGLSDSGGEVWWLSYDPAIGLDVLKLLCSRALLGRLRAVADADLIQMWFQSD